MVLLLPSSTQSWSSHQRDREPLEVSIGRCCKPFCCHQLLRAYAPLHSFAHFCSWSSLTAKIFLVLSRLYILSSAVGKSVPPLSRVRGTLRPGSIQLPLVPPWLAMGNSPCTLIYIFIFLSGYKGKSKESCSRLFWAMERDISTPRRWDKDWCQLWQGGSGPGDPHKRAKKRTIPAELWLRWHEGRRFGSHQWQWLILAMLLPELSRVVVQTLKH